MQSPTGNIQEPQQDTTTPQRKHPVVELLSKWLNASWSCLPLFLNYLTCITCRHLYCYLFRSAQSDIELGIVQNIEAVSPPSTQAAQSPDNSSVDSNALENWRAKLSKMRFGWTLIAGGSVVFSGLAVALLQLPPVFNQIYLRLAAIFVFSLSLASGFCAGIFRVMEGELGSSDKAIRWVRASKDLTSLASLDFWLCLAWPLTSLTWAIIFCITTVFALAWIEHPNPFSGPPPPSGQDQSPPPPCPPSASASKTDMAIIIAITAIMAVFVFAHFYRVFKFVWWSDVST